MNCWRRRSCARFETRLKRTALFSAHQKLGAKLIDFGGWEMPVQYTSITDEHLAVRNAAGIFDISHMGEVTVSGAGAERFSQFRPHERHPQLAPGEGQYTLMCNERGGVIDDLYAYKLSEAVYFCSSSTPRASSRMSRGCRRRRRNFPASSSSPTPRTIIPPWPCKARA
jgi:glycine cleavage system aminomethyltransferase T